MVDEKLQKVLARAGLGSRREIEGWIREGRVKVNQKVAEIGCRVGVRAKISIDGKPVKIATAAPTTQVLLYHKPAGEICSRTDPKGRPSVFRNLPPLAEGRWVMVGRLDFNTSGLLLFTNDGELANTLMHPSAEIEREYAVRVLGRVDDRMLQRLQQGVKLEDGLAKFSDIVDSGGKGINHWYHVVLCEGRNREVRRLWESQDVKVSRLMRVRFDEIILPSTLKQGKFKALDSKSVQRLMRYVKKKSTHVASKD